MSHFDVTCTAQRAYWVNAAREKGIYVGSIEGQDEEAQLNSKKVSTIVIGGDLMK